MARNNVGVEQTFASWCAVDAEEVVLGHGKESNRSITAYYIAVDDSIIYCSIVSRSSWLIVIVVAWS